MPYPKFGNKAPLFALKNQRGDTVRSEQLLGKNVVLYFYPQALTPGCTVQACGVSDLKASLADFNAIALGVSPDSVEKLDKFQRKHDLNFDLLADTDHALAEAYGVWGLKKFMGREYKGIKRTTFIIDEKGKLVGILDDFKTKTHHQVLVDWFISNAKV